jgi:hypothetical protein
MVSTRLNGIYIYYNVEGRYNDRDKENGISISSFSFVVFPILDETVADPPRTCKSDPGEPANKPVRHSADAAPKPENLLAIRERRSRTILLLVDDDDLPVPDKLLNPPNGHP